MSLHEYKYRKYQDKYLTLKTTNKMDKAIQQIKNQEAISHEFVNIALTETEQTIIDNIKITNNGQFNYFGVAKNPKLLKLIKEFISSIDNSNQSTSITKIMWYRIIKPYLDALQSNTLDHEAIWLTIRVTPNANSLFDVPRWHIDGTYYKSIDNYNIKLAGVLKGPATIFKSDNAEMRQIFIPLLLEHSRNKQNFNKETDVESRMSINEKIKNYETRHPTTNQVAIFAVGDTKKAAIHSEPKIDRERLFFSIVAGNKTHIKELAERFNSTFID